MKKRNEKANNHRLEIGERFKCGEVFISNLDGYMSTCTVECRLCEDGSICSLAEFLEHIEIWHSDWEDELRHDEETQAFAEEYTSPTVEVVQPFEKVLIVTETKTSLSLTFSESEECDEMSEQHVGEFNESFVGYGEENLLESTDIAYTVDVGDILKAKSELEAIDFEQDYEDACSTFESLTEPSTFEELNNEAFDIDTKKVCEIKDITQKKESNWTWRRVSFDEEEDDDDDEDEVREPERGSVNIDSVIIDRSEDSGVEKSEVSISSASTPQHSTSEDEASFEPKDLTVEEQLRLAWNEPLPNQKLTTEHMEKLIEIYETYPHLWQKSHPEYNKPVLCRKSWKEITQTFNKTYKQNFSIRDIRVRVSTLCQRYLKERRRREMAYEINEPKITTITSRFRYFDKLKFLDSQQSTPYEDYSSRLTLEHEKLLEIYSHFPLLWSNRDYNHENMELREKAFDDISTALQILGIHLSQKMIRQRLTALRKRYRLEKMRHLHCKLQGKTFETSFKQYEKMKFLDSYIAPYVCDKCGKIFRKLKDFERHNINKEHDKGEAQNVSSVSAKNSMIIETNQQAGLEPFNIVVNFTENQITQENTSQKYTNTEMHSEIEQTKTFQELENYMNSIKSANNNELTSTNTVFRESFMENPNPESNFGTEVNENESTLRETINDLTNLLEVPIILQNLDGSDDFRNYFNEDQFFALGAPLEPSNPAKNVNLHNSKSSFIPINTDQIHSPHIQSDNFITLQVVENAVDIPSNTAPFVPIELILNENVQSLTTTQACQESENIDIIAQYLNGGSFIENESTKYYTNNSQLIPLAINFEETGTVFENENNRTEFNSMNPVPNGITQCTSFDIDQTVLNCFSISHTENLNEKSSNMDFGMQNVNESIETASNLNFTKEFEKAIHNTCSKGISANVTSTSDYLISTTEETNEKEFTPVGKSAVNSKSNQQSTSNKTEPSLLGRLPRDQALELIARYKELPELWNPEHQNYTSRRSRRNAWRSLAKNVNKNLNTNFNWLQVQRKILDYVKYYRHERRRVQMKKGCTQWNFYDSFEFLDQVLNPPNDLNKRMQRRTQTLKIIEIYKTHSQIWNTRHPHYTKRNQRQRTIKNMLLELQELHGIKLDEARLKQRLLELRKDYRTAKLGRIMAEKRNEVFESQQFFEFYENLNFLEDHVPPFDCGECKMEFKCFTVYDAHMKKEHKDYKRVRQELLKKDGDGNFENICHVCGIKFTMRHNLLQHLNRHYVGRTCVCLVCGKKFYSKNSLKEHERIHTKEPAVICDNCGKTFVNSSKLNQHMKRHRNQRDHKCEQCNKAFYTAFDRDRHMRRHLKIRDKVCPVCGKAFVMGSSYYTHMKLHSDKKEYACTTCNKEFAQYAGLYKHRRRYHPTS